MGRALRSDRTGGRTLAWPVGFWPGDRPAGGVPPDAPSDRHRRGRYRRDHRRGAAAPGRRAGRRPCRTGLLPLLPTAVDPRRRRHRRRRQEPAQRGLGRAARRALGGRGGRRLRPRPPRGDDRGRNPPLLRRPGLLPRARARLGPRARARRGDGDAVRLVELHLRARPQDRPADRGFRRRHGSLFDAGHAHQVQGGAAEGRLPRLRCLAPPEDARPLRRHLRHGGRFPVLGAGVRRRPRGGRRPLRDPHPVLDRARRGRPRARLATLERRGPEGGSRETVTYDLLHAAPPQRAPAFVRASPLAGPGPLGWVPVDRHSLRHTVYPEVFSLGDVCDAPTSKTGAAARVQAAVVAEGVVATLEGREPRRATRATPPARS